jgi:hypothetical protein
MSTPVTVSFWLTIPEGTTVSPLRLGVLYNASIGQWEDGFDLSEADLNYAAPGIHADVCIDDSPDWNANFEVNGAPGGAESFCERVTATYPGTQMQLQLRYEDEGTTDTALFRDGRKVLASDGGLRTLLTTEQVIAAAIEDYTREGSESEEDVSVWAQHLAARIDRGDVTA